MPKRVCFTIFLKNVPRLPSVRKLPENSVKSNVLSAYVSKCSKRLLLYMQRETIHPRTLSKLFSPVERCACKRQEPSGGPLCRNSELSFERVSNTPLGKRPNCGSSANLRNRKLQVETVDSPG